MSHKSNQHPVSGDYYPNKTIKEHTYKGKVRTDFVGKLYSVTDFRGFVMRIRTVLPIDVMEGKYKSVRLISEGAKKGRK